MNKNAHIDTEIISPTSSGKSTLLEYIKYLSTKKIRTGCFTAIQFPDLPRTDWGYIIEFSIIDSPYIKAYRSLSNGEYHIRGMSYNFEWLGNWQQINTPNHQMLQSMNNYFNINDSNYANILLYKFSEENWGGIGIEPDGTLAIRVGTSNSVRRIFRFRPYADSIEISDH